MTPTLRRIDSDRSRLHATLRNRLNTAAQDVRQAARRASDPLAAITASDAFRQALTRQATIAYLKGMQRAVLECKAATGRDVRPSLTLLSRDKDDKRDETLLLWLIAFLGLTPSAVAAVRERANEVAVRAAGQLKTPVLQRVAQAWAGGGAVTSGNIAIPGRLANRSALATLPRSAAGDVFGTFGKADAVADLFPHRVPVRKAFDAAGVGRGGRLLDLWAETVAYSQYEAGRHAGDKIPAVADLLYGYRWMSVLDNRTSNTCRTLDGWVAPVGDTWMEALRPPLHFHCRSMLTPVYQSSGLKRPQPTGMPPLATLNRYLAQKEAFLRYLA